MIAVLDKSEIDDLLRTQVFARLGCYANGESYVVPVAYVFDPGRTRLVMQSKPGKKIEMMRQNPQVCFEIDAAASLTEWRSAIVWGHFEELQGATALEALGLLVDRFRPLLDEARQLGQSPTPPRLRHELARDIIYCIHIERVTGRWEDGAHEQ